MRSCCASQARTDRSAASKRRRLLLFAGVLYALAATSAAAQSARIRDIDVPGGPASIALSQLGRQAGVQILAPRGDLDGVRTNPVSGRLTPRAALQALIAGTSLRISAERGGVITIRKATARQARSPPSATPRPKAPPPPRLAEVATAPLVSVEEVLVPGSLVVRGGFAAPTPVTVLETSALLRVAPANLPDGLNQLPQFLGSRNQAQNGQTSITVPQGGNYLNLRNLGIIRSLVLLDGQRLAPTSYEGIVDANVIPQALVQRIDVVTAGAAATYGSDALTGVINFVLDKRFTGLRASVQGGISTYGDNNSWRTSIASGQPIAGGRGHLLLSFDHYKSDGVKRKEQRDLYLRYPIAFGNGRTIPYRIEYDARYAQTTLGGLILSGPLAYQKFEPDGRLTPFDRGVALGAVQLGGDGGRTGNSALASGLRTDQAFARLSYDLTDRVTGFVQATAAESRSRWVSNGMNNRLGNITIYSGNAFLRPEIQARLDAAGIASFRMGRQGIEQGGKYIDTLTNAGSLLVGLEGVLPGDWRWRANLLHGRSYFRAEHQRNGENLRYYAAIDAVRHPTTGQNVCRITLTHPSRMPGCVPLNEFGVGASSNEAREYVFGATSQYRSVNKLDDLSFNVAGAPWALPAGEVSVALGAEIRRQTLGLASNADPATRLDTTGIRGFPIGFGRFVNTNVGSASGDHGVKEVFGELVLPLLKDLSLARSLELNGAVRAAEYDTSGAVQTYKLGFNYLPFADLRLRATVSRDIRAPSLYELFAGESLNTRPLRDTHTGVASSITTISSGNRALTPEIGLTETIGVVYRPQRAPQLAVSVDYFNIEIQDAIGSPTADEVNDACEVSGGVAAVCALVIRPFPFSDRRPENTTQRIRIPLMNLERTYSHGLDIEATYSMDLGDAWASAEGTSLALRLLANYTASRKTQETPTSVPRQDIGVPGVPGRNNLNTGGPKWLSLVGADIERGLLKVSLQARILGRMQRSNVPTVLWEDNVLEAVTYTDVNVSRAFETVRGEVEAFVAVNNLFNVDPPVQPRITEPGLTFPTVTSLYDMIGRYYTVGLRLRF